MAKVKELKLTADLKNKLMGYSIANGALAFTPEIDDIPAEYLPTFKIKNLSNKDYNDIKKMSGEQDEFKMEEFTFGLLRKSIVGWENFIDIAEEVYVDFETDEKGYLKQELFELIPITLKNEMFRFILKMNGL